MSQLQMQPNVINDVITCRHVTLEFKNGRWPRQGEKLLVNFQTKQKESSPNLHSSSIHGKLNV